MSVSEIVKAINGYSPTQIATIEAALATRRAQLQQRAENARAESARMLARMTELVAEAGLTVSVAAQPSASTAPVIAQSAPKNGTHRKAKRSKFRSKVLFRDPTNHKRTWSGRGPQPQWMKGDREQYRVGA